MALLQAKNDDLQSQLNKVERKRTELEKLSRDSTDRSSTLEARIRDLTKANDKLVKEILALVIFAIIRGTFP